MTPARIGTCGVCRGAAKVLVRSHILPQWLGRDQGGRMVHIQTAGNKKPEQVRNNGTFDFIVCELCEQLFGGGDDYAADFIRDVDKHRTVLDDGYEVAIYEGRDQARLRRFALGVMLRAHLSSRRPFHIVDLGTRGEDLRAWFAGNAADPLQLFEVAIQKRTHAASQLIYSPIQAEDGNWHFALPGLDIWVNPRPATCPVIGPYALGVYDPDKIYAPIRKNPRPGELAALAAYMAEYGDTVHTLLGLPNAPSKGP